MLRQFLVGGGVSLSGVRRYLPAKCPLLGQKQTSGHVRVTSALPPKADTAESDRHVRFVPKADIAWT